MAAIAAGFGFLILRRRGVYFSLLTLALAAMLYAVSLSLDRGHRRRERPRRHHATDAARIQSGILDRLLLVCGADRLAGADPVVALPSFARRQRAGGDPRERAARTFPRLSDQPLQAGGIRAVGRYHRPCRGPAALPEPHDIGRSDFCRLLRRLAGDGRDRRHAQLPRPGARSPVLYPVPRVPRHLHRELAALVWPCVRGLHRVFADRPGRCRRAIDRALPQEDDRRCRNVGAPDRSAAATGISAPQITHRRSGAFRTSHCQEFRRYQSGTGNRHQHCRSHAACADRPQRRRQDHRVQLAVRHVSTGRRNGIADGSGRLPGILRRRSPMPASAARSRSPICFRR